MYWGNTRQLGSGFLCPFMWVTKGAYKPRDVPPSVCLSVRIYQRVDTHWTDFREILYRLILRKSVEKFQIWLKRTKLTDTSNEDLRTFYVLGSNKCSAAIQTIYCCVCIATLSVFITVLTYVRKNHKEKRVCAPMATNVTRTRHNLTFYILCLFCSR